MCGSLCLSAEASLRENSRCPPRELLGYDRVAPDPASRLNPDASPLRAANFAGLPPAVVLIAEHDPLRDEGEAYAAKLHAAGVPVESRRFLGQMHGFFQLVNVLPGSADGLEYVAEHVNARLGAAAT